MHIIANKKRALLVKIATSAFFIGVVFFVGFLSLNIGAKDKIAHDNTPYPEIKEIRDKEILSFVQLSKYFTDLADKKGGGYAFKVLAIAPIPPNIDMHLLGHGVGDVLYKQQGIDGIKICTQDFRNACSHSIVVGLLLEKGEGVLPEIAETCKQAPGGSGAYTMCFHGLGHGVLAYSGYDLPKAIKLCDKTGTKEYNDREAVECIGGTIMEIIGGGFHNKELWEVQSKKYLLENDPLFPCNADFMPEKARNQCYIYLTPHLFMVAGGPRALGAPTPADFEKAFQYCDKLPKQDLSARNACYGGFGKEFVVLAKNRDIRNIDNMTEEEMRVAYKWCALAVNKDGTSACVSNIMSSIYWGGESNRSASIRFCGIIDDNQALQDMCFYGLINAVNYYIKDPGYKRDFCVELPAKYQINCKQQLSIQ